MTLHGQLTSPFHLAVERASQRSATAIRDHDRQTPLAPIQVASAAFRFTLKSACERANQGSVQSPQWLLLRSLKFKEIFTRKGQCRDPLTPITDRR
jgi:hypothetical protein